MSLNEKYCDYFDLPRNKWAIARGFKDYEDYLTTKTVNCKLYKRKCIERFCSVAPFFEKCIYLEKDKSVKLRHMAKSKVVDTIWISTIDGTIGIVLMDNGFEKKAYIKKVSGINEESDAQDVLENGGKLLLPQAIAIVEHLKS